VCKVLVEAYGHWNDFNIGGDLKAYLLGLRTEPPMPVTPAVTEQAMQFVRDNVAELPAHLQEEWKKYDPAVSQSTY
jgi:hypothetical protein